MRDIGTCRKILTACRRFPAACAAFLMLTVLTAGCGKASADPVGGAAVLQDPAEKRLQVVATIFPQYDFARQIAGDSADVHMLLKPGEEVHSYEPTPQDIRMIQKSDLFIYVGGENDVWVDNILESLAEDGPVPVRLLDLVDTRPEEQLEGMMPEKGEHDHEAGEEEADHAREAVTEEADHAREAGTEGEAHIREAGTEGEAHIREAGTEEADHDHEVSAERTGLHSHVHEEEPDEHVWTSPENCAILIGKLTDLFCELDPGQADSYRKNGDAYRAAFVELDAQYRRMAAGASRRTILFGDRFPFRYLAEELGLTCYAAFSGCSSESEPNAATIAFLIDKAAEERLPVVFKIEFSNGNIASAIREAAQVRGRKLHKAQAQTPTPVRVLQLHSCHNLTRDEFSAGETCLSLMTRNLEALREALY